MYVNSGNARFQSIRKSLYVDKSGLISFINKTLGTKDKLTCVSRPRRFGKSFAAQMLCAYYDKSCDSRELFCDLEISKDPSFETNLNRFDVICLDIIWFISTANNINDVVSHIQEQVIQELCDMYCFNYNEEKTLPNLLAKIAKSTGNKFIIIIDEWDAIFRESKYNIQLQEEYIKLLRDLFNNTITNEIIEAAYMTGILPIKKCNMQSVLPYFREYTMIKLLNLAQYVGFTEAEVIKLCRAYIINFDETKHLYCGYYFENIGNIYNPNSIIEAISNQFFSNYWVQTETYKSLKTYINMDFDGLNMAITNMLKGDHFLIDTSTFQNDLISLNSRDDVLTLLVHFGYLAYDTSTKEVFIPNKEILEEFNRAIK